MQGWDSQTNGFFLHVIVTNSSKVRMHRRARGATFKEPKLYFIYLMPDPIGLVLPEAVRAWKPGIGGQADLGPSEHKAPKMLSFKRCFPPSSSPPNWRSSQAKCWKCFLEWLQQFDNCDDQLFAIAHGKKKCKGCRIINTLPQTKKGRYSGLNAMAAPQQTSYKVSRPHSPVVFSWKMFSQCNCRHSYEHRWYHREKRKKRSKVSASLCF